MVSGDVGVGTPAVIVDAFRLVGVARLVTAEFEKGDTDTEDDVIGEIEVAIETVEGEVSAVIFIVSVL